MYILKVRKERIFYCTKIKKKAYGKKDEITVLNNIGVQKRKNFFVFVIECLIVMITSIVFASILTRSGIKGLNAYYTGDSINSLIISNFYFWIVIMIIGIGVVLSSIYFALPFLIESIQKRKKSDEM